MSVCLTIKYVFFVERTLVCTIEWTGQEYKSVGSRLYVSLFSDVVDDSIELVETVLCTQSYCNSLHLLRQDVQVR